MATITATRNTGASQVAIGERFGLYEAMSESPVTASDLAKLTGLREGFVSDWLTAQVHEDFLVYDAATGRYANYCNWPRGN